MPVESAADRAVFVNADEFGEAVYWPEGSLTPISVLPQAGALIIDTIDGPGVQGLEASFVVPESMLPVDAAQGDAVTFRGRAHLVKSILPDGTGMVLVRLEENED